MPVFEISTDRGTFHIDADREPTPEEARQAIEGHLAGNPLPAAPAAADFKRSYTSPSGRSYKWAKHTPPTQDDIDALVAFDAQQEPPAATDAGYVKAPSELPDTPKQEPIMAGNDIRSLGSDARRDSITTRGNAAAARYGLGMAAPIGGPIGSAANAGGEALAQWIEGSKNPGAVAKAAAIGAVPLGQARGILNVVKNAAKMGGASVAGGEAESLINDGRLAGADQVVKDAALGGVAPIVGAGVGRVMGKVTGIVAAEDVARLKATMDQNALEDATLAAMRKRGAVVPPSNVNDSRWIKLQESIAGPTNLENRASKINAPVFNQVARQEASIAPNVAMHEGAFDAARAAIAKPYQEVRSLGLGDKLDAWREANNLTRSYQRELSNNFTVAGEQAAKAQAAEAERLFNELHTDTTKMGRPDLADALSDARVKFAKNFDSESATNVGNGSVNTAVLEQMLRQRGGKGLSGGLNDLARFHAAFPDSARVTAGLPTSPSAVTAGASLLAASAAGSPAGAVLRGGVPLLRGPIAARLLSPEYQAANAVRTYKVPTSADPLMVRVLTRAIANKKREEEEKKKR